MSFIAAINHVLAAGTQTPRRMLAVQQPDWCCPRLDLRRSCVQNTNGAFDFYCILWSLGFLKKSYALYC